MGFPKLMDTLAVINQLEDQTTVKFGRFLEDFGHDLSRGVLGPLSNQSQKTTKPGHHFPRAEVGIEIPVPRPSFYLFQCLFDLSNTERA